MEDRRLACQARARCDRRDACLPVVERGSVSLKKRGVPPLIFSRVERGSPEGVPPLITQAEKMEAARPAYQQDRAALYTS